MTTQFVTSHAVRVAYDISGEGPPVVLLHGAGRSRQDWHAAGYVARLSSHFTAITIDLRGSGESDALTDPADFAIEWFCDDVFAVVDACGIERFAVWGYSLGGNIARYLGAWSERLRAIAIVGVPFGAAIHAVSNRQRDDLLKRYPLQAQRPGDELGRRKDPGSGLKGGIPALIACLDAMRTWPEISPGEVGCPALLVAGTRNKLVTQWLRDSGQALQGSNVELTLIEGLNHLQEFSQVDRVYPLVEAFLLEHAR